MKAKELYNNLIQEYLQKGGSQSFIDKLSPIYSLQNEAKLRFELRKLSSKPIPISIEKKEPIVSKTETNISEKATLENLNDIGLISEYPISICNI